MTVEAKRIASAETQRNPLQQAVSRRRDRSVDTLRGFALFGIIMVNVPFFAFPIVDGPAINDLGDRLVFSALWTLAIGKFFLIFSFLFGFGFAVSISADARAARASGPRFARRLFALLVFGAFHAVFFFIGDILMLYAALGVLLWFSRALRPRTLMALSLLAYLLAGFAQAAALTAPPFDEGDALARAITAYRAGFWEAVRFRLWEDLWVGQPFILVFNGPAALSMFLAGLALAKAGRFPGVAGRRASTAMAWLLLAVGITVTVVSLCYFGVDYQAPVEGAPVPVFLAALVRSFAAPLIAAGYGLLIIGAADRWPEAWAIKLMAVAGQMTLTGYLLHSVLLSFVFGGWGLALYGRVSPVDCLMIGVATYSMLILLFVMWRRWFRYGPDEWLLRSWIDLEAKPFRISGRQNETPPPQDP